MCGDAPLVAVDSTGDECDGVAAAAVVIIDGGGGGGGSSGGAQWVIDAGTDTGRGPLDRSIEVEVSGLEQSDVGGEVGRIQALGMETGKCGSAREGEAFDEDGVKGLPIGVSQVSVQDEVGHYESTYGRAW